MSGAQSEAASPISFDSKDLGDIGQGPIVHIITRFIRGGADENTLFTCNGQAELGREVHLITGYYHPDMVAKLDSRIRWLYLPSLVRHPSVDDVRCVFALTRLLRRIRPFIVHTHESKAGILGRLAARICKVPIVVHGVHILPFVNASPVKRALYLGLEKIVAPVTDGYVSVSEEMQRICIAAGLGAADRHSWVPSGMSTEQYRNAARIAPADILPSADGRTIGLIAGHLEKRKQISELITALGAYRDRHDWTLLVAGEGPEQAALAKQIADAGLNEHVILLGYRTDLPNLLASADVVLHAAGNEGLPRVVIQATLAGKPVVSPALPGIDKVVADGRNGLLNSIDDFETLARNFIALVNDPEKRRIMSNAARAVDLSPWTINTMVTRISEAYRHADRRKFGQRRAAA